MNRNSINENKDLIENKILIDEDNEKIKFNDSDLNGIKSLDVNLIRLEQEMIL